MGIKCGVVKCGIRCGEHKLWGIKCGVKSVGVEV